MLDYIDPFLLCLLADMVIKSEIWGYDVPKEIKNTRSKWQGHRKAEEKQGKTGRANPGTGGGISHETASNGQEPCRT